MEKNNGRGIFYGVIGVATLVVAIIGATFAYFASAGNTADNAIEANTADIANYAVEIVNSHAATGLIPVDSTDTNFASKIGFAESFCKDVSDNTYPICGVYELKITNASAVAQQTYVNLKVSTNTFTNLKYAIYDGSSAISDGSFTAPTTALVPTATFAASGNTQLTALGGNYTAGQAKTFYIVVWLEETKTDQTTTDKGKTLAAGITVSSSADGNSGVTAVLSAS